MMKLPKISVITATYNSEKYLEQTILSLKNQSYKNIEYIIVDGASIDDTHNIIKKYRSMIDVYISEPDKGNLDAFNKGVKASTGDIIYFLNSDDYLYGNDAFTKVVNVFIKNPEACLVYGKVICYDERINCEYINGKALTLDDLKKGEMAPHQAVFAKKKLIEKHGFFDLNYPIVSDYDFLIKCFKEDYEKVEYLNEVIAVYRLTGCAGDPRSLEKLTKIKRKVMEKHFGSVNYTTGSDFQGYYRIWLEMLLIHKKGILNVLHKQSIRNIAIFGTMKTAIYLLEDAKIENFKVMAFLDNNESMHGKYIDNIEIKPTSWLLSENSIECVIVSIESSRDAEVIDKIEKLVKGTRIKVFSWKNLIDHALK